MARDYYQVLSVERDASETQIRRAFRVKAKEIHPDHNPDDPAANAKFIALKEAHDLLVDPVTRKKYDRDMLRSENTSFRRSRQRAGKPRQASTQRNRGAGPHAAPQQRRGHDIERTIRVTLEQICKGSQHTVVSDSGRHTVYIKGIPADNRIRCPGKGGFGENGGPDGDLHIIVEVMHHKRFTRDGDDLRYNLTLNTGFAQRGGEKTLHTPSGKIRMTIKAGTKNGRTYRLAGKGLPRFGTDDQFGDLYVHIEVRKPVAVRGLNLERNLRISLREAWAGGERHITVNRNLITFTVPPGAHDGQRIFIAGEGRPGKHGGLPGDLCVTIEVKPDKQFRRAGDDLYLKENVVVEIQTALKGGEIEIPAIAGNTCFQILPGKLNGGSLRVPGLGMPRNGNPENAGDLVVHIVLKTPAREEWRSISSAPEPGSRHDTWYWPSLPHEIFEPNALYMKIQYKGDSRSGYYDWAVLVNDRELEYRGRKKQFSGKCYPLREDNVQAKRDAAGRAREAATAALLQRTLIEQESRNMDDIPFDVSEIPF